MNWLLVGSVGGGVTIVNVESGGMTYSAAQKLADEINAMYAAQQNAHLTLGSRPVFCVCCGGEVSHPVCTDCLPSPAQVA